MKIIGKTSNGFIMEVSEDDAYRLAGWHGQYYARERQKLDVGTTFNIHEMYNYLAGLWQQRGALKKQAEELRKMADKLDKIPEPIVGEPAK